MQEKYENQEVYSIEGVAQEHHTRESLEQETPVKHIAPEDQKELARQIKALKASIREGEEVKARVEATRRDYGFLPDSAIIDSDKRLIDTLPDQYKQLTILEEKKQKEPKVPFLRKIAAFFSF